MQSKFVVVEVSNTNTTMSLVEYLVTHGFEKFAVVADLCDHPSLKYKDGSLSPVSSSTTVTPTPPTTSSTTPSSSHRPKVSINDIANALSKKTSPINETEKKRPDTPTKTPRKQPQQQPTPQFSLTKLLEDHTKAMQAKKEHERQQAELQRILITTQLNSFMNMSQQVARTISPEFDEQAASETVSKASSEDIKQESDALDNDYGLGPSDEQVRASMIHLLNPAFGSAFGLHMVDENTATPATPKRKNINEDGVEVKPKKHRWLPVDELEESRAGRGKNMGRVHCKATYKCALCGKPTTLNSTGSRWNLLRHVIMIHSDCKPYQCWDCDFVGIKSNVISHARQSRHRADDAHDITTDEMRAEWNILLHQCFPDYVKAKERGWAEEAPPAVATTPSPEEASEPSSVQATPEKMTPVAAVVPSTPLLV